jgi:hypothetical protein
MSTPTPSPLTEQLDSAVNEIHIMPGFGNRLTVLLYKGDGIPEPMTGAVASVTVYGDGRISYEPIEEVQA